MADGTNREAYDRRISRVVSYICAVLEYHGPPERLMASVARFIEWRKSCRDSPVATRRTLGIAHHDTGATSPEEYRFDICGELSGPLSPNDAGVVEKVIPRGRCAVARHIGSTDAIGETVHELYAKWLPESGQQLRDFPPPLPRPHAGRERARAGN
jgi:AraC family transcriptional regulator